MSSQMPGLMGLLFVVLVGLVVDCKGDGVSALGDEADFAALLNKMDEVIETFTAMNTSLNKQVEHNKLISKFPVVQLSKGRYTLHFEVGKQLCQDRGSELATLEDLKKAQKQGLELCSCGWVTDGQAYYPMQSSKNGCGNNVGVNHCFWGYGRWNVWCKSI